MSSDLNDVLGVGSESKEQEHKINSSDSNVEKKYASLRVIAVIYRVLAFIWGAAAVITLIYGITMLGSRYEAATGMIAVISSIVGGIVGVIGLCAFSDILKLFMDLESNSRKQTALLFKMSEK
jgi:hypothetical protein